MNKFNVFSVIVAGVVSGCTTTATMAPASGLPGSVLALAAPGQNLATVRLQPDNCYWYLHTNPIETTLLPLRTVNGRPICAG